MALFFLRRLSTSILLLVLVSLLVFATLRVLPGDPVIAIYGGTTTGVDPAALANARHEIGIDKSIPAQYVDWIKGIAHGDLGRSYFGQYPVTTLIGQRLGPTIELTVVALLIALLIAIPLGLLAAIRPNSRTDRAICVFIAGGIALPSFILGIILIFVFAVWLQVLPAQGFVPLTQDPAQNLKLIILPAVTIGLVAAAPIARFLRAGLIEANSAPYMLTAQGKGLRWSQAVRRHGFPNALIPSVTFVGIVVGHMLGGVVVIEYVFGWQGLGALAVDSVQKRDYAVLQADVIFVAALFILTTLVVDLLYGVIDPRLRVRR